MSLETILRVSEAETAAAALLAEETAQSAALIAKAETAAEVLLQQTYDECARQRKRLIEDAEQKGAEAAQGIRNGNAESSAALRQSAEVRLEQAAALIVEKVVAI